MVKRTAEENRYWKSREALAKTKIKEPKEIANLPWHGNHASDMGLFQACEHFIREHAEAGNIETAREALFLMGKCGMGVTDRITNKILREFLADGE